MFFLFPLPSFRNPILLLIFPCVLAAGVYRERLRKKYNFDVSQYGSLAAIRITASDFDTRLLDCFKGPDAANQCFLNCCCCPVRLATNASATGCNDYWYTLIMSVFFLPVIPIIGYIVRMHIRDIYDMDRHPVADFFAWCCCYCCALTQESKFLDYGFQALQRGTSVVFLPSHHPTPPRTASVSNV
jgi:Cys-rich protein (TIGR01571 family)